MAWADTVTLEVSVAFTTDPLDTPTWVDVTAYVKDPKLDFGYGRDQQSGMFRPGAGTITLANDDRRFDPLNSSGPYYGDLVAGRRVRIRAVHSGTTYDEFYAFVDEWKANRDRTCTLVVVDAFGVLAGWPCPDSVWAAEVTADNPHAWYRFDGDDSDEVADASGNRNPAYLPADASSFTADSLIVGTQDGGVTFPTQVSATQLRAPAAAGVSGTTWSIEFWVQIPWQTLPSQTYLYRTDNLEIAVSLNDDRSLKFWLTGAPYILSDTSAVRVDRPNHIVAVRDGTDAYLYVNGAEVTLTASGSPSGTDIARAANYGAGEIESAIFDDLVTYNTALSAARVLVHYQAGAEAYDGDDTGTRIVNVLDLIGWPSALREIDTAQTSTVLGPAIFEGSVLDYIQKVAVTEAGWLFCDHRNGGKVTLLQRYAMLQDTRHTTSQETFSDEDTGGVVHYSDAPIVATPAQIFNEIEVAWTGGTVVCEDTASITAYGRRSRTVDSLCRTESEARALGNWTLAQHSTQQIRVPACRFQPSHEEGLWPGPLARKIGDRVTFSTRPGNTGARHTDVMWIDSITHTIRGGVSGWETIYGLSPCLDAADYWRWGQDTWDTETRWSY